MNAEPQFLTTEGGDELVVLSRRAYDALLARLGDEEAEDRMTARMADDHLAAKARGDVVLIPAWFVDLTIERGSPLAAARRHASLTQVALAARLGVAPRYVRDLERGRRDGTAQIVARVAEATGVEVSWLVEEGEAPSRAHHRASNAMRGSTSE